LSIYHVYSGKRKKKGTTCVFQHPYMSKKSLLEIILRTTTKRKYLSLIKKRLSLLAIASSFILWFSQWKSKLYTREIIIHNWSINNINRLSIFFIFSLFLYKRNNRLGKIINQHDELNEIRKINSFSYKIFWSHWLNFWK
jgi:hypothetical protein